MKKFRILSFLMSAVLLLQCLYLPALAEETATEPTEDVASAMTTRGDAPFGTVCVDQGCRSIDGMVPLGGNERKLDTAAAAFVYEVNTGTVVYSYNPDLKLSPGTLTKMVLALLVAENCDLDEIVTCVDGIQSYVPGSAQKLKPNLKSGEQLPVRDLLYGLVLGYANDAAVALAQHVYSTTSAAVTAMNERVKTMGCRNTEFGNISGLDTAANVSTAREMALIMTEVNKNATLMEIMQTATYDIQPTNLVESKRALKTGNYLQDNHVISQFFDKRVTSGMASNTEASGASLMCNVEHNGMKLVVVTLGSLRIYDEETGNPSWYGNFEEALELIKFICNNFKVNRIIYDGMAVCQWSVIGGECEAVGQARVNVDSVVPATAAMDNLIFEYTIKDGSLTAPVEKGEKVATAQVWYRNSCMTEIELFSMGTVRATSNSGVTVRSTAIPTDKDSAGFMSVVGTVCVIILGVVGVYLAYNSYMRSRIRAQRRKRRSQRRRSR